MPAGRIDYAWSAFAPVVPWVKTDSRQGGQARRTRPVDLGPRSSSMVSNSYRRPALVHVYVHMPVGELRPTVMCTNCAWKASVCRLWSSIPRLPVYKLPASFVTVGDELRTHTHCVCCLVLRGSTGIDHAGGGGGSKPIKAIFSKPAFQLIALAVSANLAYTIANYLSPLLAPSGSFFPAGAARLSVIGVGGAGVTPTAAGIAHFGLLNGNCDIAAAAAAFDSLRLGSDTARQSVSRLPGGADGTDQASTTLVAALGPASGKDSELPAASGYFLKLAGDAPADTDPVAWNVDALQSSGNGSAWVPAAGSQYGWDWRHGRSGVRQWGRLVWEDMRPLQEPVAAITWPLTHVINQARMVVLDSFRQCLL